MKAEDTRYNVGDIIYALQGRNRINDNIVVLHQRVEAVLLEVDDDGQVTATSYILTDDLGKYRSTKVKAVFATLEEALDYAKNSGEWITPRSE